jgi:hypothetical protein
VIRPFNGLKSVSENKDGIILPQPIFSHTTEAACQMGRITKVLCKPLNLNDHFYCPLADSIDNITARSEKTRFHLFGMKTGLG